MEPFHAKDFPHVYEMLLYRLLSRGYRERNERTGKVVATYPFGGFSFTIDLRSGLLPVVGHRKLFPATAAAETAWYVLGTQDASFMMKHARVVWEKFVEPRQAKAYGHDEVPIIKAAYGYRWRRHFGRDQLDLAIQALRGNPSDRRVYISAWDPSEDGLGAPGQLNVPCPVGFTFSIVDGRLCSTYLLRSSDVFVGLPYDVMGHALLMAAVAATLGVPLGHMTFTLAHPHLYDVHFEMAREALYGPKVFTEVQLPAFLIEDIEQDPDGYVQEMKQRGRDAEWPAFCPKPEVVQ